MRSGRRGRGRAARGATAADPRNRSQDPSLPPELEAKLDSTTHARLDSFASQLRALQPETQVSAVKPGETRLMS